MRKKLVPKPNPFDDTGIRTRTHFLWFPKTIDDEWRWLETATYKQVYRQHGAGVRVERGYWQDFCWEDKESEEG